MTIDDVRRLVDEAFEADRVEMTRHFWDELEADGFALADVVCAFDGITRVVDMGVDREGNPKIECTGPSVDGRLLSVICSFKETNALFLITAYEAR